MGEEREEKKMARMRNKPSRDQDKCHQTHQQRPTKTSGRQTKEAFNTDKVSYLFLNREEAEHYVEKPPSNGV